MRRARRRGAQGGRGAGAPASACRHAPQCCAWTQASGGALQQARRPHCLRGVRQRAGCDCRESEGSAIAELTTRWSAGAAQRKSTWRANTCAFKTLVPQQPVILRHHRNQHQHSHTSPCLLPETTLAGARPGPTCALSMPQPAQHATGVACVHAEARPMPQPCLPVRRRRRRLPPLHHSACLMPDPAGQPPWPDRAVPPCS